MNDKFILLIEDSDAIRDSLIWALEGEGFKVKSATNGQEGLQLLGDEDALPLLILLDMMMPIMNG